MSLVEGQNTKKQNSRIGVRGKELEGKTDARLRRMAGLPGEPTCNSKVNRNVYISAVLTREFSSATMTRYWSRSEV